MKIELKELEEKIRALQKNRNSFAEFLETKMDEFDYSNTTLAKKVFHQVEDKETHEIKYVPVTRQAIASWLKGTMPGSREVYISLGMAFSMPLRQINHEILEVYMGTGLYCKNVDDAVWIAVINRLFPLFEIDQIREQIEEMVYGEPPMEQEAPVKRVLTTDLWRDLEAAATKEEFFEVIRLNRDEFRDGAKQFGQCLSLVIEEEYGYFEKSTEFLGDIGCLHCEAQFSKIRAGKAIVTREWLLRFLLSLQPSYESIDKLLKKAQMEPLGITPVEIVIEEVARKKSDSLANSQEIWSAIEQLCAKLEETGIPMDDELCRKYDSVFSLPEKQRLFFAALVGKKIMECEKKKDYGYVDEEYCRHQLVDRILFEELNRFKKNSTLKTFANHLDQKEKKEIEKMLGQVRLEYLLPDSIKKDLYHLERFSEYCYMRQPKRRSNDYYMNDIYFYSALLYSIFTGRCFVKDFDEDGEKEVRKALKDAAYADWLIDVFYRNLGSDILPAKMIIMKDIVITLLEYA
ncbi:MAG: hypothetical protein Q4B70_15530 [Lachnospiraceae bacterium]|nr:hypothetical protein [Lachnospiraceae bacterium]